MIMSIGVGKSQTGSLSCMVEEQSQALRAYAAQAGENLLLLGTKQKIQSRVRLNTMCIQRGLQQMKISLVLAPPHRLPLLVRAGDGVS